MYRRGYDLSKENGGIHILRSKCISAFSLDLSQDYHRYEIKIEKRHFAHVYQNKPSYVSVCLQIHMDHVNSNVYDIFMKQEFIHMYLLCFYVS